MIVYPECPHRHIDNCCSIVEDLIERPYVVGMNECQMCSSQPNAQQVNHITIAQAVAARAGAGESFDDLLELSNTRPTPDHGPGTELKKILSWFGTTSDCGCDHRAASMDEWGVPGCERHFDEIVEWLVGEAKQRGLPLSIFHELVARKAVRRAINNAKARSDEE